MSCGGQAEARTYGKEREEEGRERRQPAGLCELSVRSSGQSSYHSPVKEPWPDLMFIIQHKERLQKMGGFVCQ